MGQQERQQNQPRDDDPGDLRSLGESQGKYAETAEPTAATTDEQRHLDELRRIQHAFTAWVRRAQTLLSQEPSKLTLATGHPDYETVFAEASAVLIRQAHGIFDRRKRMLAARMASREQVLSNREPIPSSLRHNAQLVLPEDEEARPDFIEANLPRLLETGQLGLSSEHEQGADSQHD